MLQAEQPDLFGSLTKAVLVVGLASDQSHLLL